MVLSEGLGRVNDECPGDEVSTEGEETLRLTTLGSSVLHFISRRTVAGVGMALLFLGFSRGDKYDLRCLCEARLHPGIPAISSDERPSEYINELVVSTMFGLHFHVNTGMILAMRP